MKNWACVPWAPAGDAQDWPAHSFDTNISCTGIGFLFLVTSIVSWPLKFSKNYLTKKQNKTKKAQGQTTGQENKHPGLEANLGALARAHCPILLPPFAPPMPPETSLQPDCSHKPLSDSSGHHGYSTIINGNFSPSSSCLLTLVTIQRHQS
jgi:hypothetical protein